MAGLDEILKLQQPTTQASDGTGITSGLTELAEGFEQFNQEVDNAEDPKQIMDLIRGDSATVDQRRAELAGYVGETDASKTPESVLTIVQPLFEAMEVAQNPSTMQEETMPMEQDASLQGGIVQSPGMEEAISRIQMGEQPKNFYMGGMNEMFAEQQRGLNLRRLGENYLGNTYTPDTSMYPLSGSGVPNYSLLDLNKAVQEGNQYVQASLPYLPTVRTKEEILADQQQFLAPFIKKPRTVEQIMAEREALGLSDDVKKQANIQNALALARFGAGVASEGGEGLGGLLQALTAQAPGLTKDLGQVSALLAQAEAKEKEGALAIATQERLAKEQQDLNLAVNALSTQNLENKTFEQAKLEMFKTGTTKALETMKFNVATINNAQEMAYRDNNSFMLATTDTYYVPKKEGGDGKPFTVRKSGDGLVMLDGTPIPKNAIKLNTMNYTEANKPGVDFSGSKAKNILIPLRWYNTHFGKDSNGDGTIDMLINGQPLRTDQSGYVQVPGYFAPKAGYFIDVPVQAEDGTVTMQRKQIPIDAIAGNESDIISVDAKGDGRTITTYKTGPNAGQKVVSQFDLFKLLGEEIKVDTTGDGIKDTVLRQINMSPEYQVAPRKEDANGNHIGGNPLAEYMPLTNTPVGMISTERMKQMTEKVHNLNLILNKTQDVMKAIDQAVGFKATLKGMATNTLAPFDPTTLNKWTEFLGSEQGKEIMDLYAKELARGLAISDRYAWAEQQYIINLAEDPRKWIDNPAASKVRFQELTRMMINQVNYLTAEMAGGASSGVMAYQLNSMPSGTPNDPVKYMGYGQMDYLQVLAKQGVDWSNINGGKGITVRFPKQQALQLGINIPQDADYKDLTIIGYDQNTNSFTFNN